MVIGPIVGPLLILATVVDGNSDADDCVKISASYEAVVAAVADASHTYQACVAASRGRDDCTAEYGDLDLAAARFEAVVADYGKACRPGEEH